MPFCSQKGLRKFLLANDIQNLICVICGKTYKNVIKFEFS